MKKLLIVLAALAALFILWVIPSYNGIVNLDEKVSGKWADVESQYQRRSDLIPNLVATVKGYADREEHPRRSGLGTRPSLSNEG